MEEQGKTGNSAVEIFWALGQQLASLPPSSTLQSMSQFLMQQRSAPPPRDPFRQYRARLYWMRGIVKVETGR